MTTRARREAIDSEDFAALDFLVGAIALELGSLDEEERVGGLVDAAMRESNLPSIRASGFAARVKRRTRARG